MGRPQFVSENERPQDQQLRNEGYDFEREKNVSVTSGIEYSVSLNSFPDEPRIVESVSIDPTTIGVRIKMGVLIVDNNDGTVSAYRHGFSPEQNPLEWNPGARIDPDERVEVQLYQESGSDVDLDVVAEHRGI